MKKSFVIIIIFTLLVFCAAILQAQNTGYDSSSKTERWILSFSLGADFEGPSKAIEKVMEASEFGHYKSGGGNAWLAGKGGEYYPQSKLVVGGTFGFHYLVKSPFAVGILASYAQGETKGMHISNPEAVFRDEIYLNVDYSILTFAPLVSIRTSWFKFGVGGALHYISTYQQKDKCWKFGFLMDSGLIVPFKGQPYFVEITFQYRSIGEFEIGPYTATEGAYSATIPVSRVNYSHFFVGIGFGIRL